jgi:hypothetical protein
MPTVTTFPNGQTLTSSALTDDSLFTILQPLTCGMIGLAVSDPARNYMVRKAWQTAGAPAWKIDENVISIQCTPKSNWYDKVRDVVSTANNDPTKVTTNIEYTRVWSVRFIGYGPGIFDMIRLIRTALLLSWTHDTLAQSNLYLMTELETPSRNPEQFEGQWWQRTDLGIELYEQVNETLVAPSIASVEIVVETKDGIQNDFVVDFPVVIAP